MSTKEDFSKVGEMTPTKHTTVDNIFGKLVPLLICIAGIMLIFVILQLGQTSNSVAETAAYTRVSNCIVAKSANPDFTQDEIERCYVQVEKNTGISLERFDFQIHNED